MRCSIRDKTKPSVYGHGILGIGKNRTQYKTPEGKWVFTQNYQTWKSMIKRCYYAQYHEKNPTYKDCEVCERWLNFQNFCEDVPTIEGYEEWLCGGYHLDKDIKIEGNKIYGPDTCMFVPAERNIRHSSKKSDEVNAKCM